MEMVGSAHPTTQNSKLYTWLVGCVSRTIRSGTTTGWKPVPAKEFVGGAHPYLETRNSKPGDPAGRPYRTDRTAALASSTMRSGKMPKPMITAARE